MLTRLLASTTRRVLVAAGAVLVALAAWGVFDLLRIQRDINTGETVLRSATATDMARPNGVAALAETALGRFQRADNQARTSLPFKIVRPIPLLGRHVAVIRSMTQTATQIGGIGGSPPRAVQAKLDVASDGPAGRVGLLDTAVGELERAQAQLRRLRVTDDRWVLPPLSGARERLEDGLVTARVRLRDAAVMADALRAMFIGPSRYLILAGNNAEMRSGGMPLSAGVAEIRDGAIVVGDFVPTYELFLTRSSVPVPKNLTDLYGWMTIGAEWRATTATPNFPESGRMYSEMARPGRTRSG